jgi:orotate phosphoribosyltransferase
MTADRLHDLMPARTGHFRFESGHHGDLWLDLDTLFCDPPVADRLATALSDRLADLGIDLVCGAMTGGALLGQLVAHRLGLGFVYTERTVIDGRPVYALPSGHQRLVAGQRVALVDEVINAGSATGGTRQAVVAAGGQPVVVAALLVLGDVIDRRAAAWRVPVVALERRTSNLWPADECPLCRAGMLLEDPLARA